MAKYLHLTIPEPCHEKWNKMSPQDKGRFCNACQKQVVDFTTMSDQQLQAFFTKPSTGSVCGRFANDQLGRSMPLPSKKIPWLRYFIQIALPAFLLSTKATAQGKVKVRELTATVPPKTTLTMGAVTMIDVDQQKEREVLLKGRVTDTAGNGLPDITVALQNDTLNTVTDSLGYYRMICCG